MGGWVVDRKERLPQGKSVIRKLYQYDFLTSVLLFLQVLLFQSPSSSLPARPLLYIPKESKAEGRAELEIAKMRALVKYLWMQEQSKEPQPPNQSRTRIASHSHSHRTRIRKSRSRKTAPASRTIDIRASSSSFI